MSTSHADAIAQLKRVREEADTYNREIKARIDTLEQTIKAQDAVKEAAALDRTRLQVKGMVQFDTWAKKITSVRVHLAAQQIKDLVEPNGSFVSKPNPDVPDYYDRNRSLITFLADEGRHVIYLEWLHVGRGDSSNRLAFANDSPGTDGWYILRFSTDFERPDNQLAVRFGITTRTEQAMFHACLCEFTRVYLKEVGTMDDATYRNMMKMMR